MDKQYLLIHNLSSLYSILKELKNTFSFDLKIVKDKQEAKKISNAGDIVISKKKLELENQIQISDFPIGYTKLIDILNIAFLKKKIDFQKNIKVGKYTINYNSRELIKNNEFINLTEKETKIIKFLKSSKKPVTIMELQKKVWGYKSDLETHTVETHVYRLRKKILDRFKDRDFITSFKNGYIIKTN